MQIRLIMKDGTIVEEEVKKVNPSYGTGRWIECTNLDGTYTLINVDAVKMIDFPYYAF